MERNRSRSPTVRPRPGHGSTDVPVPRLEGFLHRVAGCVQGREHFARQYSGLFEYGPHEIRGGVLEAGQGGDTLEAGDLVDDELHIVEGGMVVGHGVTCS